MSEAGLYALIAAHEERIKDLEKKMAVMEGQLGYITTCFESYTNKMIAEKAGE